MAIVKKGSRKIAVEGIEYRWRVSKYRNVSNWRHDSNVIDGVYQAAAKQYGLGDIANVVFNIPVELYENPVSKIMIKYYGIVVDGFLGIEQLGSIKPTLISQIIKESLLSGWLPNSKGDYSIEVVENTGESHRPAILLLPGFGPDIKNYDNQIKLIQIQ
jgi:hypothetical protein